MVGGLLEVVTVVDGLVVVSGTWMAWQLQKLKQIINDAITANLVYKLVIGTGMRTYSPCYLFAVQSQYSGAWFYTLRYIRVLLYLTVWYYFLFPKAYDLFLHF